MRVVLDTNVLIAAFITRGVCSEVMDHCLRNHDVVSAEILLDELHEKLTRKLRFSLGSADEAVSMLRRRGRIVNPSPLAEAVSRDPDDDWFGNRLGWGCGSNRNWGSRSAGARTVPIHRHRVARFILALGGSVVSLQGIDGRS